MQVHILEVGMYLVFITAHVSLLLSFMRVGRVRGGEESTLLYNNMQVALYRKNKHQRS